MGGSIVVVSVGRFRKPGFSVPRRTHNGTLEALFLLPVFWLFAGDEGPFPHWTKV